MSNGTTLKFSVTPSLELVHPVTSISDPAKTTTGKLTLSPDLIIPAPMEAHGVSFRRVLELAFCVAGIWSAYIYQGVLQETVSTKRFGPNKERFEHLAFLNFAQSSVCLIWSFMMIKLWPSKDTGRAPWWSYWSAGITNTIGPAMGIEALKYISYPAQVLAKSSKMIPVMVMGTLVYGIRYTLPEYLCTLLVAGGVSAFALAKSSSKTISKLAHPNAPLGYGLCFLNLAFDGFTNATQDSISARYPKTGAWDIMLGMNLWGAIYNFVFMFGWPQASGYQAIEFCKNHPEAGWDILYYCLCGAIGQNFIFFTISRFGSLTNTTITTTRKFVSIVVSSVVSGNPLSRKQWGSVVMVFSGLSYQIYLKWQKAQKKRKTM
uniref:Putative UDP-galactose transporter 3 n=2 Tax=Helianthus annuus TaxID=4232 RepID=A0A251RNJ9_HELAN